MASSARLSRSNPWCACAPFAASLVLVSLSACGAAEVRRTPDESDDVGGGGGGPARVVDMPTGLGGSEWRWTEAHCTEGPLDLAARGFSQHLRIQQDGESIVLTYDQAFAAEQCEQTVVQRVSPPPTPGELRMEEIARVAVPSTPACFGQPEAPRPGEVRRVGERLEVLVQRSVWCGGFEVRMVYERTMARLLTGEEIARRYAAYFSRGDAARLAGLFAETGSLLEPFTETATGDPYRHDGRAAVLAWFSESLREMPWRAMRITGTAPGDTEHSLVVEWEYMDPRLTQPVRGRTRFTIAAGEIFEAQLELLDTPSVLPSGGGDAAESTEG